MLPFSKADSDQGINEQLLREYAFFLAKKAEGTIEAYLRTVRQVMIWIAGRPGNGGCFQPQHFTKTAVEMYLASLEREGFSLHHRASPIIRRSTLHSPFACRAGGRSTRSRALCAGLLGWLSGERCLLARNGPYPCWAKGGLDTRWA